MNQLPQIFRQTQQPNGFNRQGPFFSLKLNQSFHRPPSVSLDKTSMLKLRPKINRHSVDRSELHNKRYLGYSTISYDHHSDPEFVGTKGKKDLSQSYNVLIQERNKACQIVGLKVASCRGFKEQYQAQLRQLGEKQLHGLKETQQNMRRQIRQLKQTISQLRRETGQQIKSMRSQLKEFNNELLVFCEEFKRVEKGYQQCMSNLQQPV